MLVELARQQDSKNASVSFFLCPHQKGGWSQVFLSEAMETGDKIIVM